MCAHYCNNGFFPVIFISFLTLLVFIHPSLLLNFVYLSFLLNLCLFILSYLSVLLNFLSVEILEQFGKLTLCGGGRDVAITSRRGCTDKTFRNFNFTV